MRPKKVVIFEPYIFDRVYGNLKYILTIFKYIDKSQYHPILVSQEDSAFLNRIKKLGGQTVILTPSKKLRRFGGTVLNDCILGRLATLMGILRYSFTLYNFYRHEKIDIVHCNSIRALLVTGFAAKLAGKPIVWYIKGHLDNPYLDRIGFWMADRILFQSETNKRRRYAKLLVRYEKKIQILPNGIDLKEVEHALKCDQDKLRLNLDINNKNFIVAYIGQISPLKGVHLLIEAMADVVKTIPDVILYLIGDHCNKEYVDYINELKQCIISRKLKHIKFTGYRSDAISILALADLFVLPSFSEGFPRSIMEAMALGKPVVSTGVGGVPDLVEDGVNGLIVPVDDIPSLTNAILRIAGSREKAHIMGLAGQVRVYKHHNIMSNISGLMRIYDSLISPQHNR